MFSFRGMILFRIIILYLVACLCLAEKSNVNRINTSDSTELINLAVVACGDRKETLVLLKSALMFTRSYLYFIIITEPNLKKDFIKQVTPLLCITHLLTRETE